jgi:hypothetical protein
MRALRSAPVFSVSDSEKRIAEWLYDRIDPADFSRQVLSPGAKRLVTLRLGEVEWNDLGDPDRVISTLLESGLELPSWATRGEPQEWLREAPRNAYQRRSREASHARRRPSAKQASAPQIRQSHTGTGSNGVPRELWPVATP